MLFAITLLLGCSPKLIRPDVQDFVQQSHFIFRGTIQKVNASNVVSIPQSNKTAIVRVDEIIDSPRTLPNLAAQDLTILLKNPESIIEGDQAFFFTQGYSYGATMSIKEVGHLTPDHKSEILKEQIIQAITELPDRNLLRYLAKTDLVVLGKVKQLNIGKNVTSGFPISEHDPRFGKAMIEIQSVLKGSFSKTQIEIQFATSEDVMWLHSPKPQLGQEGVWLLHKGGPKDRGQTFYFALEAIDFMPLDRKKKVKKLLKSLN